MAHLHSIYDTDPHFSIDPASRVLTNRSETKTAIVQGDHNSERFTFELPREIEGHDMLTCNRVQVHYINIDMVTKEQSTGVYTVDDLQESPESQDVVICSWLVSSNATKYVGSLNFVLRFYCVNDDKVEYVWSTTTFKGISVSNGIDCGEPVVEEYADILLEWERELKANQITGLEQTKTATEDDGENVWTATFGDGRREQLKVRNGSRGPTGLVGSIETIDKQPLHFFVGTKAEYDALPDTVKERQNLFAIITDDKTKEELFAELERLSNSLTALDDALTVSGEKVARHASAADTATEANDAKAVNGLDIKTFIGALYNGNTSSIIPQRKRLWGRGSTDGLALAHASRVTVPAVVDFTKKNEFVIVEKEGASDFKEYCQYYSAIGTGAKHQVIIPCLEGSSFGFHIIALERVVDAADTTTTFSVVNKTAWYDSTAGAWELTTSDGLRHHLAAVYELTDSIDVNE